MAALRETFLAPLRNQAVFHNDRGVSEIGLSIFVPPYPQSVARGSSEGFMDVYFPISDIVAFNFIANRANAPEDFAAWLAPITMECLGLARRICGAIDDAMSEGLRARGLVVEAGVPPEAG